MVAEGDEAGRASLDPDPPAGGLAAGAAQRVAHPLGLVEFVCIDTSLANELEVEHYFDSPEHLDRDQLDDNYFPRAPLPPLGRRTQARLYVRG